MTEEYTPNVKLYKPNRNDDVEVDVSLSENFTKIDDKFGDVSDQLAETAKVTYDIQLPQHTAFIHRGFVGAAPENTIAAIKECVRMGEKYIELDLRATADNVFVIHHDSTIDRMTNGTGTISQMTLSQIQTYLIDAGNNVSYYQNEKIPTFEEVLKLCKKHDITILLHMNDFGVMSSAVGAGILYDLVKKYKMEQKIIFFGTNTYWYFYELRKLSKELVFCYQMGSYSEADLTRVKELQPSYYGVISIPTKAQVEYYHNEGIKVMCASVYTINDYHTAKNNSVDIYISDVLTQEKQLGNENKKFLNTLSSYKNGAINVTHSTTLDDNTFTYDSAKRVVRHKKVSNTVPQYFKINLIGLNIGDVVEFECFIRHISGTKPNILMRQNGAVDFTNNKFTNFELNDTVNFVKGSFIVNQEISTQSTNSSIEFGYATVDVGEYEISDVTVNLKSKKGNTEKRTLGCLISHPANSDFTLDTAYVNDLLTLSKSGNSLRIDHPFTIKKPIISIQPVSYGDAYSYEYRIINMDFSYFDFQIYDKATNTQVTLDSLLAKRILLSIIVIGDFVV